MLLFTIFTIFGNYCGKFELRTIFLLGCYFHLKISILAYIPESTFLTKIKKVLRHFLIGSYGMNLKFIAIVFIFIIINRRWGPHHGRLNWIYEYFWDGIPGRGFLGRDSEINFKKIGRPLMSFFSWYQLRYTTAARG